MRIGQVSKKYNISIDNLYYYINYGLLVPQRPSSQYVFDAQTIKDLEMVLELKEMNFTLKEIHKILSLYRISGLAVPQDIEDLKKIYGAKLHGLRLEQQRAEKNIVNLEQKIAQLSAMLPDEQPSTGLPITMLDYLCCPCCGNSFSMENVRMDLKYIFSGDLQCECGYRAAIDDGILLTPNKNQDLYDTPDLERKLYKDLPPSLISLFQRSYNWMVSKLERMELAGKVVLETYINAWFFLHNHQHHMDPAGKYIVIDKYPEMLRMYKGLMEQQGYGLDILFIADSSTNFPLRQGCVDLNIDYFAVNEHNFYHNSFLYDELEPYLKKDAQMLGTYFYFENGKKSMENLLREYPTASMDNFDLSCFLQHMNSKIIEQEDLGYSTSSGANIGFSFHHEGERMYLRSYLANRP